MSIYGLNATVVPNKGKYVRIWEGGGTLSYGPVITLAYRDSFRKISKGGGGGVKARQKTFWGGAYNGQYLILKG